MRKYAAIILAAAMLGNICVHAAPTVEISENKVTVSLTVEAGEKATLFVVRADASVDDDSEVYAMRQATADQTGKATFSFAIPEEKNSKTTEGEYTIYAKQTRGNMQLGSFFFADFKKREAVLSDLKEENLETVLENAENEIALKALGVQMDLYKTLTKEEKSSMLLIAEQDFENAATDKEYITAVNFAIVLELLNGNETKSEEYVEKLGLTFEETAFSDIADKECKSFIVEYIYANREYASAEELKKSYEKANILYAVNNTRFTNMENTLSKYAKALEIEDSEEYEKYLALSSKDKANQNLVDSLTNSPAASVDDLLDKIADAIPKSTGSSSGGGSSGGGSSVVKGSSGGSVPGISSTIPTVKEEKIQFSDLSHVKWAEEAINYLAQKGIVSGDGDGKFNPDRKLTREEFVKMLIEAMGKHDKNAECNFDDVIKDKWYYSYVASAFKSGMVKGVSDTEFGIGKTLSRQDMAVMCQRAIKESKKLEEVREYTPFADEDGIMEYAKEAVKTLYKSGMINGESEEYFNPTGTATRAQGAVIIYNLFKE